VSRTGASNRRRKESKEKIDVARLEALCSVLKTELPKLVATAFTAFKAELPKLVPGLSDAEWEVLKRNEDQRRARAKRLYSPQENSVSEATEAPPP